MQNINLFSPSAILQIQSILQEEGRLKTIVKIDFIDDAITSLIQANILLADDSFIDEQFICTWFASKSNLDWIKANPINIDIRSCAKLISSEYAKYNKAVVLDTKNNIVRVGFVDAFASKQLCEQLQYFLKVAVEPVFISPADFNNCFKEFYLLGQKFDNSEVLSKTKSQPNSKQSNVDNIDSKVAALSTQVLNYAFINNVSDIHIEPHGDKSIVRVRIDGVLHTLYELQLSMLVNLINRFKVIGDMDISEMRRPQDGRVMIKAPNNKMRDLRLSTINTYFGEKLVIRIFDPEQVNKGFADIGMPKAMLTQWQQHLQAKTGMLVVVGPTGSGKTTTLYQSLKFTNNSSLNICTVEDPVEMIIDGINQVQVKSDIEFSFAAIIRTLMRQDPDIIMVGEIRDLETAQMALRSALTGHLLLTTVHANDTIGCLSRLIDIGLPPKLLVNNINCILAQRLLRLLCKHCKQASDDLSSYKQVFSGSEKPSRVFIGNGCDYCHNSGYIGRIAIFELLTPAKHKQLLAMDSFDSNELSKSLAKVNFLNLKVSAKKLVLSGKTSCEEVLRVLG